jgi:hypothetical protein
MRVVSEFDGLLVTICDDASKDEGSRIELTRSLFGKSKGAYRPLCSACVSFKLRQISAYLFSRQHWCSTGY